MERIILFFGLIGIQAFGFSQMPKTTGILLGPDSFQFCGGWIELWGTSEFSSEIQLHIKLSPPAGKNWKIWNAHAIVEHPDKPDHLLDLSKVETFDTKNEKGNVAHWTVPLEGLDPRKGLKVAFRPFEGCETKQEMRGVVLHRSK